MAEGLRRRGWDFVRAVDLHGEGALDPPLFEHAAALGRVFVTNDGPLLGRSHPRERGGTITKE